MSDFVEGIGAAIDGSLTAKAVEPHTGRASGWSVKSDQHASQCANCGAPLAGEYCNQCGQKAHVHRTLTAIGHDLLHGVLHLDGKLWDTLPLLTFKPGELTRRYIEGERARFVSPMAMFLFSVFAMFAVFQMVGLTVPTDIRGASAEQFGRALDSRTNEIDAGLESIEAKLASPDLSQEERTRLEVDRSDLVEVREGLSNVSNLPALRDAKSASGDGISFLGSDNDGSSATLTGIDAIDKNLLKKWREHPDLMLYTLQANGYKFSWLLIPLSIPFVWLTFAWRRRYKAYDHAIFVTYSLSFMSLLFIAASLLALIPNVGGIVALLVIFVPPIHLYKQLRGAYQLSRFSAFWRLMALSAFIWIVLLLFLQALLLLGAF